MPAAVSRNSYLQALPPGPGILQENVRCLLPISDAALLILGICYKTDAFLYLCTWNDGIYEFLYFSSSLGFTVIEYI